MEQGKVATARRAIALAAALALAAAPAWAQAPAAAEPAPTLLDAMSDNVFLVSVLFVFLAATIGAIFTARRRDRVLKSLHGYHVTLALKNGDRVWGHLRVFPNGMMLQFDAPFRNRQGNDVDSFIVYQGEYASVRAVQRVLADLDEEEKARRARELRASRRPTLWRRGRRWAWRQVGTLRDAILQAFTLFLGAAKRARMPAGVTGSILATQDARLAQISGTVLGGVQLANDPILEERVGFPVVVETNQDGQWIEVPGMLRDYSAEWLEVWDAWWTEPHVVALAADAAAATVERRRVTLARGEDGCLVLSNEHGRRSARVVELLVDGEHAPRPVDLAPIEPGGESVIARDVPASAAVTARLAIQLRTDLLLPRAESIVRHTSPSERMGWSEQLGWRRGE